MTFPTVDALARELARLEDGRQTSVQSDIPEDPAIFAAQTLGFELDDWQQETLTSPSGRKILCCGRQTGKSTVGAILAVHRALTRAGSTILVVAPGERQAKLLYGKALSLYRKAGYPVPASSERRTGLELSNGSIIEALPAQERTTRGYSVDLLICDEAAAIPDADYYGLLPSLIATRGEQLLLSTPRGKRGFFWELWADERDPGHGTRWFKKSVRSDEVERIRQEDLEVFRSAMPEDFFKQEFECSFLDATGSLFSTLDIEQAIALGEEVEGLQLEDDEW